MTNEKIAQASESSARPTPAQFAQVKALFLEVCDLPEAVRSERLKATAVDSDVVAQVCKLLTNQNQTGRLAQPVLKLLYWSSRLRSHHRPRPSPG